MNIVDKAATILNLRLGKAWLTRRVGNAGGGFHRIHVIRLTEYSIPRSRKHRNSGGSEASVQSSPFGYDLYAHNQPNFIFLTFDRSQDPGRERKENGSDGLQSGGQRADG